jgi:hypothetical protein
MYLIRRGSRTCTRRPRSGKAWKNWATFRKATSESTAAADLQTSSSSSPAAKSPATAPKSESRRRSMTFHVSRR